MEFWMNVSIEFMFWDLVKYEEGKRLCGLCKFSIGKYWYVYNLVFCCVVFFLVWFWFLIVVGFLVVIVVILVLCVYCCKKCCWYVLYWLNVGKGKNCIYCFFILEINWFRGLYRIIIFGLIKLMMCIYFRVRKLKLCMFMLWYYV